MLMSHGAVVQLPRANDFSLSIASDCELTLKYIDYLAITAVQMSSCRSLWLEHVAHDFYLVVAESSHVEFSLSTFEAIDGLHRYFIEINHHNILSVFEFVGAKVIKKCGVG